MEMTKRFKSGLFIAAAVAALALPSAATAGPGGGHGGGMGGMGGAGMQGGMSGMHGSFGGNSASHIGSQGLDNGNGPTATTRTFGGDRADLRNNQTDADEDDSVSNSTKLSPNGGRSSTHMSAQGLANTNGPNATNRVFGRDRATLRHNRINARFSTNPSSERAMTARLNAQSRMSAQGLANGNGVGATTRLYGRDRANARHALHPTGAANGNADE